MTRKSKKRNLLRLKRAVLIARGVRFRRQTSLTSRGITLARLEDTSLDLLNGIVATATSRAYKNAVAISDEIIEVIDGKLVQQNKRGNRIVLKQYEYKTIPKGKVFELRT